MPNIDRDDRSERGECSRCGGELTSRRQEENRVCFDCETELEEEFLEFDIEREREKRR